MLEIYIEYDSLYIIKYFELLTANVFTVIFTDCHFDETLFLKLRKK
jgi:hypothetical protein